MLGRLAATDLRPLSGRGRFTCSHCGSRILDMKEAFEAIQRGSEVMPADAATAKLVADWLQARGNDRRAAQVREWAAAKFPPPEPDPTE